MLKLSVITFLIMSGLLVVIFALKGDWSQFWKILEIFGIIVVCLLGMYVVISLLWFRNRLDTRFTVSSSGITAEMTRGRDKVANRFLAVLGLLTDNPSMTGTGLIAMSRESVKIHRAQVCKVKQYPLPRVITIMDSWHVILRLYCTPENYQEAVDAVRAYTTSGANRGKR